MDYLTKEKRELHEWQQSVKRACRNHVDGIVEIDGMYFETHTFNRLKDRTPEYIYAFCYDRNTFVYLRFL